MDPRFKLSLITACGALVLTVYFSIVAVLFQYDMAEVENGTESVTQLLPSEENFSELPGEKIFNANCKACHRINQKLVGPALAGIFDRQDSIWVINFIRNSSKVIESGDPYAVALFEEYNRTVMTAFPSLTDQELRDLLEFLKPQTIALTRP